MKKCKNLGCDHQAEAYFENWRECKSCRNAVYDQWASDKDFMEEQVHLAEVSMKGPWS